MDSSRRRRTLLALIAAALALGVAASPVLAANPEYWTRRVSPTTQHNATEPSVAVDPGDGTVYVAWQASGGHVARSTDRGHTWRTVLNLSDVGDVHIRVGGPTPCRTSTATCRAGSHRVYLTTLEETPLLLQTHLNYTDDRGAHWTANEIAATNPSFIDRPWLAVQPSTTSATHDRVYISYHDFSVSQINVVASTNGGQTFGPSIDVLSTNHLAFSNSFCNTIPSGIEVDRRTGEVYVQWITADPVANTTGGCNLSQIEDFHQVWVAHSAAATGSGALARTAWDAHLAYDGGQDVNTDEIFASLAVDDSGRAGVGGWVYSVFPANVRGANQYDVWMARSTNHARTWLPPVRVTSGTGRNYFPWVAAGSAGRVAFVWLKTSDLTPTDTERSAWYWTASWTSNARQTTPLFHTQRIKPTAMHVGSICTNGIFCTASGGNRDLADSISIVIDRGGSLDMAITDQGSVVGAPTQVRFGCWETPVRMTVGADAERGCDEEFG